MSDERVVTAAHYLAGIVGFAMLRDWYGSGEINDARFDELAAITNGRDAFPFSMALRLEERELIQGYAEWAPTYDGPNPMIAIEERVVLPIIERVAGHGVRALDAACGTGRHAALLSRLGCSTDGVDQSEHMLAIAREKVPGATFSAASLESLPFDDATYDLIVCSLALCHLSDPTRAVAELARVLRPGGTLVISDPHPMGGIVGGQAFYGGFSAGEPMRFVRNYRHQASTWFNAFRAAGLVVDECHEPPFDEGSVAASPSSMVFPQATALAFDGLPCVFVWVVRRG